MHIVDSIVTPASTLITLSKVNGVNTFNAYFYCDLPISFSQNLALQNSIHSQNLHQLEYKNSNIVYSYYIFYQNISYNVPFKCNIDTTAHLLDIIVQPTLKGNGNALSVCTEEFINNLGCNFKAQVSVSDQFINETNMTSFLQYYAFKPINVDVSTFLWFLKPVVSKLNVFCSEYIVEILNVMFSSIFFLVFFLFFFKFFVKTIRTLSAHAFVVQKLKKEMDQEVSSFEDILAFVIFFIVFFINNLNLYTPSQLIEYNIHITFWALFICFYLIVILLPINLLFTMGSAGFMYIKGSDKNNSIIAYIILDIVVILSFFLRFLLQIIRWCLFLTTYYLLHEFVFEWTYNLFTYVMHSLNFINEVNYFKTNNIFVNLIIQFVRYVFEIFDTCLILTIQITAFIAVILWLFNYLFSISLDDMYETLFEDKINI